MVKKIGITGGIGSGKTTLARLLEVLGYPVYYADIEAKQLMHANIDVVSAVKDLFGASAYIDGLLNRQLIASRVFSQRELLDKLNAIVHPAVRKHFIEWSEVKGVKGVVFQEAAILFENGSYKYFDKNILVTAPEELRVKRVLKRDGHTQDEIKKRIANQWTDERKERLADYVLRCDGQHLLMPRVLEILKSI